MIAVRCTGRAAPQRRSVRVHKAELRGFDAHGIRTLFASLVWSAVQEGLDKGGDVRCLTKKPTSQPTAVTPFVFPVTGKSVRAVMIEGKPMFVASEVAAILGYAKPQNAVSMHCKHAKLFRGGDSAPLTSNPYGINLIPESDVFRLIMRSKLPAAEQFEAWVTETVLPAIRKDGGYVMGEERVKTYKLNKTKHYPPPSKISNKGQ